MKLRYLIFAVIVFSTSVKTNAQDPNWVKNNTWYFDNFVKDILPWSMFRETFIGVAPSPSADFDQVFYDNLYKDQLAAEGHCYGIDVMAMLMLKNGGHLGYCHPPYMYSGTIFSNTNPDGVPSNDSIGPADQTLKTAIGLVHGNQINHTFLSYLLDVIAIGKSRDGRYSYQQVDFYLAKNDYPVISVTKDLSPADGGHVIIPYFTKNMGATKRIYVYDPNRSYYKAGAEGKDWYDNGNNYIEVNSATGAWTFDMGSSNWSGSPGGGGHCMVIPVSVAGKRDRLPQSLFADGAYALNTVFIFGNVKVQQISNMKGDKRFFNDKGTNIEPCEENRLTNVLPLYRFDGVSTSIGMKRNNAFFFRGSEPVKLQYKAAGQYRIGMIFHGKYYQVSGNGKGELLEFSPEEKHVDTSVKQSAE
jgi:hypothetical protein